MLLQVRKSTTNNSYQKVWAKSFELTKENYWNPISPELPQIVQFLQLGLEKGLGEKTL